MKRNDLELLQHQFCLVRRSFDHDGDLCPENRGRGRENKETQKGRIFCGTETHQKSATLPLETKEINHTWAGNNPSFIIKLALKSTEETVVGISLFLSISLINKIMEPKACLIKYLIAPLLSRALSFATTKIPIKDTRLSSRPSQALKR